MSASLPTKKDGIVNSRPNDDVTTIQPGKQLDAQTAQPIPAPIVALAEPVRDASGALVAGSPIAGPPVVTSGATVTVLARTYTNEAMNVLAQIMRDDKAPSAARASSAQALLDRGWGKAPIQIDLNIKAKFDDFLRDVGASVKARAERERAAAAQVVTDVVTKVVIEAAIDDQGREDDEQHGAE
jgi:hypothetical protein